MAWPYFEKRGGDPSKKSMDRKTIWQAMAAIEGGDQELRKVGGDMGEVADRRWRKFVTNH